MWVMRFSQPVTRTVQKGNREEQKCQKATITYVIYLGSSHPLVCCHVSKMPLDNILPPYMLCDFGSHNKAFQVFKMPKMKNYSRLRCNIWKPVWLLWLGCEACRGQKHHIFETWGWIKHDCRNPQPNNFSVPTGISSCLVLTGNFKEKLQKKLRSCVCGCPKQKFY